MIDERTEESAALYAFDLLEDQELAAIELRLQSEADLRELVRELRDAASALSHTAPSAHPTPELKQRLMARISNAETPQVLSASPASAEMIAFPLARWLPWAAAAGFALLAALLGQNAISRRSEASALKMEATLAQIAQKDAENRLTAERLVLNRQLQDSGKLVADANARLATASRQIASLNQEIKTQGNLAEYKIATLSSMLGNSPQALAVAVWNPNQQTGIFTVEKMPAAGRDNDYELWVIDAQQKTPISAGVFAVSADGSGRATFRPEAPVGAVAKFAVSREKKGGAPAHGGPKGDVVLTSQ